jgi:hypothetical protein
MPPLEETGESLDRVWVERGRDPRGRRAAAPRWRCDRGGDGRVGGAWVGVALVAGAASLPELATDLSAVRMGTAAWLWEISSDPAWRTCSSWVGRPF